MNTRQTDMHGTYEVLHSKGSEGRDLKTGDLNLKKLSANFRFASDKVPAQNPWARTAPFNGDFILIAEFSENEGPKPVVSKFGTFERQLHLQSILLTLKHQVT